MSPKRLLPSLTMLLVLSSVVYAADQDIYSSQLMTEQERNIYRERMRNATPAEERERIRA